MVQDSFLLTGGVVPSWLTDLGILDRCSSSGMSESSSALPCKRDFCDYRCTVEEADVGLVHEVLNAKVLRTEKSTTEAGTEGKDDDGISDGDTNFKKIGSTIQSSDNCPNSKAALFCCSGCSKVTEVDLDSSDIFCSHCESFFGCEDCWMKFGMLCDICGIFMCNECNDSDTGIDIHICDSCECLYCTECRSFDIDVEGAVTCEECREEVGNSLEIESSSNVITSSMKSNNHISISITGRNEIEDLTLICSICNSDEESKICCFCSERICFSCPSFSCDFCDSSYCCQDCFDLIFDKPPGKDDRFCLSSSHGDNICCLKCCGGDCGEENS